MNKTTQDPSSSSCVFPLTQTRCLWFALPGQRSGKRLGSSLYSAGMKKVDSSNLS